MQCVIRAGEDFVFATHADEQPLAGRYAGAVVVTVPHDFRFAVDEFNRLKDPRYFAGEDGTPLGDARA